MNIPDRASFVLFMPESECAAVARVPQKPAGDELPDRILRQCCAGKTCWTLLELFSELVPGATEGAPTVRVWGYRRESNGDTFGPQSTDPDDVRAFVDDPAHWPIAPRIWKPDGTSRIHWGEVELIAHLS